MASVILENVVKIYSNDNVKTLALRDVSLHIREGEFRIIAGPSGSGKTTLLNIIGGLDRPNAGKVIVEGDDITKYSEKELFEYRARMVGFVFQFFNLIPYLSAIENVMVPMHLLNMSREEKIKRAKELLKLVGLGGKEKSFPTQLSGGEQQRLAICVALANDPPIILADEPTGELDLETSRKIVELFKKLNSEFGKTLVLVTHDIAIVNYADRISIIRDGKIIDTFTPAEKKLVELISSTPIDILDDLNTKRQKIISEIKRLEEDFKKGLIDLDTLVTRYTKLKSELDEIEGRIKKYSL